MHFAKISSTRFFELLVYLFVSYLERDDKERKRDNFRFSYCRLFTYKDNRLTMEPSKEHVFKYKGFYFSVDTTPEYVSTLEDFEIKDSDIFLVTYPKSGKIGLVSKGGKICLDSLI